jgi:integrase
MTEQLELFGPIGDRLTLSELFHFVFEYHLKGLPSERPFRSNARAMAKVLGGVYFDALTEPDFNGYIAQRRAGSVTGRPAGAKTIKHDIKLFTICWNVARKWKKAGYKVGGYDFGPLKVPTDNPTADIKRPKTKPRKRMVSQDDFAKWLEHAPDRLRDCTVFAIDTGLSPIELKKIRAKNFNRMTGCLEIQRGKTGVIGSIPLTERCREIIRKSTKAGREFILDFSNDQKEIEETRRKSGVYFWFGRDLRCTFYNEVLRRTNRDYRAAHRAMLHADIRTGPAHYEVDEGNDLKAPLDEIAAAFSVGRK